MAEMPDRELIGYCEIHCRTERALFHSDHLNRMLALAGYPENYHRQVPDGWHQVHDETMDPLVKLARERLNQEPT